MRAYLIVLLMSVALCARSQTFGPYLVKRTFPLPQFALGDLEFHDGWLYSTDYSFANIHKLNPQTGAPSAQWYATGCRDTLVTGLAWDGANMWMTTRDSNALHKLDLPVGGQGRDLLRYALPQGDWAMDLAYANGVFYFPEYLGPIHKIDARTGLEVGTIPSPSDYIYALTFDGQNLIAAEGAGSDRFWVLSPEDGTIQNTWRANLGSIVGLAYDVSSRSLYIGSFDRVTVAQLVPEPSALALLLLLGSGLLVSTPRFLWPRRR